MTRKRRHIAYDECAVEATLDLIGGKWQGVLLFRIAEQTRRFNELRRLAPKVMQRTLTNQLRALERDGLISRTAYAETPPRVAYRLTGRGRSLLPVLQAMKLWGETHVLGRPLATPDAAEGATETRDAGPPPKAEGAGGAARQAEGARGAPDAS